MRSVFILCCCLLVGCIFFVGCGEVSAQCQGGVCPIQKPDCVQKDTITQKIDAAQNSTVVVKRERARFVSIECPCPQTSVVVREGVFVRSPGVHVSVGGCCPKQTIRFSGRRCRVSVGCPRGFRCR